MCQPPSQLLQKLSDVLTALLPILPAAEDACALLRKPEVPVFVFFLKPVVCIPVLRVPTGDSLGWQAGGCCAANSPSEKINSVQFLWPIIASAPVHERRSDILPTCSSGNLIKPYLTRKLQPPAYSSARKKVGSQ